MQERNYEINKFDEKIDDINCKLEESLAKSQHQSIDVDEDLSPRKDYYN